MRRFLGLLLIPLLAVSFVASFGSSYASAVTPWDNLGTTDDMSIYETPEGERIDLGTGSTNYISVIQNSSDPDCSVIVQSLQQAWDTGAWTISMYDNGPGTARNFVLSWNEDRKDNQEFIYWDTGHSNYGDPDSAALVTQWVGGAPQGSVVISYYNSEIQVQCYSNSATAMPIVANKPGWFGERAYLVLTTYELQYPIDYEGGTLPDTWTPPVDLSPSATPEATLEVSEDGNLMVLPKTWLTMPKFATSGGELGAHIEYILYGEDNTVLSSDVFTTTKRPFTYHLPGIGDYVMRVQYVHPGIPYAPWDPPPELGTLRFEFTYNGQYILIDGEGDHCSLDGDVLNCEGGTTYIDCGYHLEGGYSFDNVSSYVDCVIYNQQTWFKSLLTGFFVPSYTFYDSWFDNFDRFFAHQFGGVYQSTTMAAGLLIDVVDAGQTTRCVLSPDGTFFGSEFSVDFCVLDDVWPVGVTAMRVIVIGVTSVALLFALLRKFNEVAKAR